VGITMRDSTRRAFGPLSEAALPAGTVIRKTRLEVMTCRQPLNLVSTSCPHANGGCGRVGCVPSAFVLYGGTGLALQLGHRVSEDFDFFSSSGFEPARLRLRLPFFKDLDPADQDAWVNYKRDNLEAFVNRDGVVKVAFLWTRYSAADEDPRRRLDLAFGWHR